MTAIGTTTETVGLRRVACAPLVVGSVESFATYVGTDRPIVKVGGPQTSESQLSSMSVMEAVSRMSRYLLYTDTSDPDGRTHHAYKRETRRYNSQMYYHCSRRNNCRDGHNNFQS